MSASIIRWMTSVLDSLENPGAGAGPDVGRRTFTRAMLLVAFSGIARPLRARTRASAFCECDSQGQCTDPCGPNHGPCLGYQALGRGAGWNCWCEPHGNSFEHVCDCACPGYNCVCATMHSSACAGNGGPKGPEVLELY